MRLNKFLSAAGVCSRRKADELIQNGKVVVNGKLTTELGTIINEKTDEILVDGKKASLPVSHVYIKLNKPKGYACTASDEHGRKTIYELIGTNERLFSIGRLDYDTEGLIILTNDGDFANHVAHPSYEIEKEYVVKVKGDMLESELAVLRKGVVENGVRMPKAGIKKLGFDGECSRLSVIIHEGQNHQVRRMFAAIGKDVKFLKRQRIGSVTLGGLKRGEYRPLRADEISALVEGK